MEIDVVKIEKPSDCNIILGQSHFIKSCEDLYESLVTSAPSIRFGLAFCESSASRLLRIEGNDPELREIATREGKKIDAGHTFIIVMRESYPINVLQAIKNVQEVCNIYCATANDVEVIIAETSQGRGILGVVDGLRLKGVEAPEDEGERRKLLREFGYKL